MKNLTEQINFTRPPSLLVRVLHGIGQAGVIIGCVFYFYAVALWDTVVAGKSADEQMREGGK